MTKLSFILRYVAVAAVVLAGSCAAPVNDAENLLTDPAANHPITVEPHAAEISFAAPSPSAGLNPADAGRFGAFVADFLEKGSGAITVSVPAGPGAPDATAYFGEKLASLGVPRSRILVGSHAGADGQVKVGYVDYRARAEPCGNWSKNVAFTTSNEPMLNFGCATQHNIAAQVVEPHDFVSPRPMSDADAARRATVLGNYEKGKATAAEKTEEQSGKVSDVAK
jgi:pilus assembly protein CpaD